MMKRNCKAKACLVVRWVFVLSLLLLCRSLLRYTSYSRTPPAPNINSYSRTPPSLNINLPTNLRASKHPYSHQPEERGSRPHQPRAPLPLMIPFHPATQPKSAYHALSLLRTPTARTFPLPAPRGRHWYQDVSVLSERPWFWKSGSWVLAPARDECVVILMGRGWFALICDQSGERGG